MSAREPWEAGLVVINTCSVRKTAEDRIWGRLGFYKHRKRKTDFKLVLMGCMIERLKEQILNRAPHIDMLVGNFQKHKLPDYIEEDGLTDRPQDYSPQDHCPQTNSCVSLTGQGEYLFSDRHYAGGFHSYVPIMHGCNNCCSYCIVPYVRGPEVSKSPDSIMDEIARLDFAGNTRNTTVREITLLGQNVNSYRYQVDEHRAGSRNAVLTFPGLIKGITKNLNKIEWLRFISSHPKDFSEELIEVIAEEKALCRHIHLPVQHGSDRILNLMQRRYTKEKYLKLVEKIKNAIPGVSLTTDILIGFPGETVQDFRMTLDLMEEVEFNDAFTYRYNPREGTKAFKLGDTVSHSEKQERLSLVIELQREHSRKRRLENIGKHLKVLVEAVSKKNEKELLARTESDEMIVFAASKEKIGHFVSVEVTSLNGSTLLGKEIN